MKKAIITGATGLVGMAVARHLTSCGVDVLCLGRRQLDPALVSHHFGTGASYLNLALDRFAELPTRLAAMDWTADESTVFFHFAWGGQNRLTDGTFAEQLDNAIHAAEAVRTAKRIGCARFVNAGTVEETFVERFLEGSREVTYRSGQTDYALAKLAARDMCRMVAYLEKIDFVHTRLSVPLAPDLSRGTYVASTLKKIARGETYEAPQNEQLFDIVLTDDVARAYYLIGQEGRNKADYFIGTSRPATLKQYFAQFERLVRGEPAMPTESISDERVQIFSTHELQQETGFVASVGLEGLVFHPLKS